MEDKIVNAGFEIVQELHIADSVLVLGVNPELVGKKLTTPYVTWECDKDKKNFWWGHYHKNEYSAERDLVKRGMEKVRFYDRQRGIVKENKERDER
jgi:hypothetical protein